MFYVIFQKVLCLIRHKHFQMHSHPGLSLFKIRNPWKHLLDVSKPMWRHFRHRILSVNGKQESFQREMTVFQVSRNFQKPCGFIMSDDIQWWQVWRWYDESLYKPKLTVFYQNHLIESMCKLSCLERLLYIK